MRLAVVSHSLIAERQRIFFDFLGKAKDLEVMQLAPTIWGPYRRAVGFPTVYQGDIYQFRFEEPAAFESLSKFGPDIIYCQEELASECAAQCSAWAKKLKSKLAYFVWENQRPPPWRPHSPDIVIAGNSEAAALHGTRWIMPQVGIDPRIFFGTDGPRAYEVLFPTGKHTREKGYDLFSKLPFTKLRSGGRLEYESVGALYRMSKVAVVPSRDTPLWKEQFAPFASAEALMSGCNVVASDTAAVKEWLQAIPGASLFPRDDYDHFEEQVRASLENWEPNVEGRKAAIERFGDESVAKNLLEALRQA